MTDIIAKKNSTINGDDDKSTINAFKKSGSKNTILANFNNDVKFFLGPLYKDVINIMEQDKLDAVNEKIFMILMLTIVLFCSSIVIYRLILYYKIAAQMVNNDDFCID
uniref:Wsv293a-like protein n=1 Tax=Metapenaeus ensis majanivirus TaxID=2984279 RepID=A0A9C7BI79_9VIRU|nr:MAG: wsv293a-like protein [Metapenaeus ensis majanivirus]